MNEDLRELIHSLIRKGYSRKRILREVLYKFGIDYIAEADEYLDFVLVKPEGIKYEEEAIRSTGDAFRILSGILAIILSTIMFVVGVLKGVMGFNTGFLTVLASIIGIIGGVIAFMRPILASWFIGICAVLAIFTATIMGFLMLIPYGLLLPYVNKRK